MLASAGLYRVSEDGRVTPLHRGSWIYPTSLVRRGEEIYIGMRWAIVHLRPGAEGAYEERWLLPEPCPSPSFDERSLRCECGSAR